MSEFDFILAGDGPSEKISKRAFEAFMCLAAGGNRALRRAGTDTYEEFVDLLYEDLDEVLGDLENRKKYFAKAPEDQISDAIISDLRRLGYTANHDTDISGHVDITVESRYKPGFLWLGEAKIDRGPAYSYGGLLQLTTRYSTARQNADRGGLLIYVQDFDNAQQRLKDWAEFLVQSHGYVCDLNDSGRKGLAFSTAQPHDGTGLPYKIRHMAIHLRHEPQK